MPPKKLNPVPQGSAGRALGYFELTANVPEIAQALPKIHKNRVAPLARRHLVSAEVAR